MTKLDEVMNATIGRAASQTLTRAKAVVWRREGVIEGYEIGPVAIDVGRGKRVPFTYVDVDREWFRRDFAEALAELLEVRLEVE